MIFNKLYVNCIGRAMEGSLSAGDLFGAASQLSEENEPFLIIELYKNWIKYNTNNPLAFAVYFNYATELTKSNQFSAAINALRESIKINPNFFPPYLALGTVYERIGEQNKAIDCWQQVVIKLASAYQSKTIIPEDDKHRLMALHNIRRLQTNKESELRQKFDPLQRYLARVVEHDLDIGELFAIYETLKSAGEIYLISELYRIWIKHNSDHPSLYAAYYNYSSILSVVNDLETAKAAVSESIKIKPDFVQSYILLGSVHEKLGEHDESRACWQWVINHLDTMSQSATLDNAQIGFKNTALRGMSRLRSISEGALRQKLQGLRPYLEMAQFKKQTDPDTPLWNPEATKAAEDLVAVLADRPAIFP